MCRRQTSRKVQLVIGQVTATSGRTLPRPCRRMTTGRTVARWHGRGATTLLCAKQLLWCPAQAALRYS